MYSKTKDWIQMYKSSLTLKPFSYFYLGNYFFWQVFKCLSLKMISSSHFSVCQVTAYMHKETSRCGRSLFLLPPSIHSFFTKLYYYILRSRLALIVCGSCGPTNQRTRLWPSPGENWSGLVYLSWSY